AQVFGEETTSHHKQWLLRRIAYHIQEQAEGGLSKRARKRARELASEAHLRVRVPEVGNEPETVAAPSPMRKRDPRLPAPGTVLVREFGGQAHEVTVLQYGFRYQDKRYRSLSAVARAITGTPWNGYRFFKDAL